MSEKPRLLLVGCTGTLGTHLSRTLSGRYRVYGVARRKPPTALPLEGFLEADIARDPRGLVEEFLRKHGGADALINNAVVYKYGELRSKRTAELMDELNVNLIAPLEIANRLVDSWADEGANVNAARNRNIINVSSIAAVKVYENRGHGTYAAAKAALHALTKHQASEFGKLGIRVNALAPNTFPSWVPLERVEKVVLELLEGKANGQIRVIERDTEYWA